MEIITKGENLKILPLFYSLDKHIKYQAKLFSAREKLSKGSTTER